MDWPMQDNAHGKAAKRQSGKAAKRQDAHACFHWKRMTVISPQNEEIFSYPDALRQYELLIPHLVRVSDRSGGVYTSTLGIEGTKIYTRLVLSTMTIGSILPANQINHSQLWDFPSVAVLSRSLIEATHRYLYLIEPRLSFEESDFRRKLHFYRINCEKYRLYSEKQDHEILKTFEGNLSKAKAEITATSIYKGLDKNMAKKVRSGNADMHLTDAQVAKLTGLIDEHYGFYYRLLSIQAHGSPLATTSQSNTRGRGLENKADSFYLALVLRLLCRYLSKSLLSQVELLSLEESGAVAFAKNVLSSDNF